MPAPIPVERRRRAVAAYLAGEGTVAVVAAAHGISAVALDRYLKLHRTHGDVAPKPATGGTKPTLDDADIEVLRELALSNGADTIRTELVEQLAERTGKRVSIGTLSRALDRLGIQRVRPEKRPPLPATPKPRDPARYQPRSRQSDQAYATDLTDAEWEVVRHHFEPTPGGRGRPPVYERRALLNAMFYIVRTGAAWRMLPNGFPPWEAVYKAFRRWTSSGKIRKTHDALREMWRARAKREPTPSAVIVDSQSVKTTEKGGLEVLTLARR